MRTTSLTALALILAALPALAQEAPVDAEAKAAIAADEARTNEIDESDALLAAEQDGTLGTEDLNAAALSVLKDEVPETTGATPEVVEEIDAIVAEAEAMMEELEAEDVAEAAGPEEIEELEEAAEDIEEAIEEAEEVLAEVEGDDTIDVIAEPATPSLPIEDLLPEGKTDPKLFQGPADGNTPLKPTAPVMRDADTIILEPLVNRVDATAETPVEAEVRSEDATSTDPNNQTNAELNAKLAELDALLSTMEAKEAAQAERTAQLEAQKLEMEIETEMDEIDAEMAELDAEMTEIDASDATTVEIEDTVTMAADGTKARKTMVIMTDASGNTTITQNAKAPIAAMDSMDIGNARTKVKVLVKKLDGADDQVNIEASGATVTESVTPDGSTRIIRVSPENGDKGTLITITKD